MSNTKLNNTDSIKPLITFALFTYNQEKYVCEAVESVLAQTYSPVEIILSDDCSPDGTFEIMQKIATAYHGNNTVIARRNPSNLGLIDHINAVCALAKGDWIVVAAGDDISEPYRVSEIVKVIEQHPEVTGISSALTSINSEGVKAGDTNMATFKNGEEVSLWGINERINGIAPLFHGATAAYAKELFTDFKPLPKYSIYEDAILSFRAVLIGQQAYIDRPLVRYRNHDDQITNIVTHDVKKNDQKRLKSFYGSYLTTLQYLDDYYHIFSRNKTDDVEKFLKELIKYNSLCYKAITWIWPFRILPYYLSRLQNKKEVSLSLDTKTRILLPTLLYFLLKNMQSKGL